MLPFPKPAQSGIFPQAAKGPLFHDHTHFRRFLAARQGSIDENRGWNFRQVELSSAVEANPVRPLLDREDSTHVPMMAAKYELEHPKYRVDQPCSRLRSQLPLASSHASRPRTLARAKAMEQSAAP